MVCSKVPENINTKMDDDVLKQVPKFKYLGSRNCPEVKKQHDHLMWIDSIF